MLFFIYLFFTFYDTGAIYFSGTGIVLASLEIKLVIPQGGEASNQTVWESQVCVQGKKSTGPFGGDRFGEGHHRLEEFVRCLSMTIGWIHETQQPTRSTACPGEYSY